MYKDGKHAYPNESSESPYFGSSVHYGGREFYSSSAQKQHANEPPKNYKEGNPDGSATRGDWWQGSLYYWIISCGLSFCERGIKGVALVAVLELLILSRQASENHSWELASGLRPSCRWRQYLDASSYLDRCGCRPCPFSVGPFVFLVV